MYTGNQWFTQKISRNGGHSSYIGLSLGSDVNKVFAGFEYAWLKNVAISARLNKYQYTYTEMDRNEDGKGLGFEMDIKYHPLFRAYEGFYVGGALNWWSFNWRWDNTLLSTSDNGSANAIGLGLQLGWRFHFGYSDFFIEPQLTLDNLFEFNVETSDNKNETHLGSKFMGGIALGMTF